MQRASGSLWKVVASKSQTAGGLLLGEVPTHLIFGENVLHAIFMLQYTVM